MINEGTQQGVAALKPAGVPVGHQEPAFVNVRNVGGKVPNPKTDPEMAPIYRAQDDWPYSFSSQVGFGT